MLNEISINDKYQKEQEHTKWNPRDFQTICQADPTYNREKDIVGKYTNWLLLRLNDISDLGKVRVPLEWYADGMKRGILQRQGINPDINTYKSIDDFINAMQGIMKSDDEPMQSASEMNNREKLEGQFKIIGQSRYWEVISPLTFEAERWFGRKTEWCTVANEVYFKRYGGEKGELYIFYPKDGRLETRIQVHFGSESYFDVEDMGYGNIKSALMSHNRNEDSLMDGVELANSLWDLRLRYVNFEDVPELLAQGVDISEIFDWTGDFHEGFAVVVLNGKCNYLTSEGRLLSPNQWFGRGFDFHEGFAGVYLNGKWNFITTEGQFLSPNQWFYMVDDFREGFAGVYLNGKYNFLTSEGRLLSHNQWFDSGSGFREGFAVVKLNDKLYLLRRDGVLCDYETKEPIKQLNENKRRIFYITEGALKGFFDRILTESFIVPKHEQVRLVREYLDKNFLRSESDDIDENGYPCKIKSVTLVSSSGKPLKPMSISELLIMLDDKFFNIIKDKAKRRAFLKQVINDWYFKGITKEGLLSVNTIPYSEKDKKNKVKKIGGEKK